MSISFDICTGSEYTIGVKWGASYPVSLTIILHNYLIFPPDWITQKGPAVAVPPRLPAIQILQRTCCKLKCIEMSHLIKLKIVSQGLRRRWAEIYRGKIQAILLHLNSLPIHFFLNNWILIVWWTFFHFPFSIKRKQHYLILSLPMLQTVRTQS